MSKINKEWHSHNLMPKKATTEQRINWHLNHVKHCSCMPIPRGVLSLMEERGMEIPEKKD